MSMPKRHYKKHLRETEDIGSSDGSERFDKLIAVGHGEKNSSDDDCVADKMHEEVICDEGECCQRTKSCSSSMGVTPSADAILQAKPQLRPCWTTHARYFIGCSASATSASGKERCREHEDTRCRL